MAVMKNQDHRIIRGRTSSYQYNFISDTHTRKKMDGLCGDLYKYQNHIDLVVSSKNENPCEVFGLDCKKYGP